MNELSGYYILLCEDKGQGFLLDANENTQGNGIANMKERVSLLRGVIEFQSSPNSGTIVHVRIPKHETTN